MELLRDRIEREEYSVDPRKVADAIVRRGADHVTPGHFHLRHRRRGVFTFDARGAAGEKLLRAQRADDHVFVCA